MLVDIWRSQKPFRGQMHEITRQMLDRNVFSKQYFDREGLIVAVDEAESGTSPLGFVHASFAPTEEQDDLDPATGIISLLQVMPGQYAEDVGRKLLDLGIDYLKKHDARTVYAGSRFPFSPFYLGMYGGALIPGVMEGDSFFRDRLSEAGFQIDGKIEVLDRDLADFRAVIDREQMTLRRQYQITAIVDPVENSWWESCTMGLSERDLFSVSHKLHRNVCGSVCYWDVSPMSMEWGNNCRGIYDLNVAPELRQFGMATFLVGESLRHLMLQGVEKVEAQARETDDESLEVFRQLGFQTVTHGHLMSRPI